MTKRATQNPPLNPPFEEAPRRMHDTISAAACIGVASATLDLDRVRHRWRIPYCKIGRKVLYKESDLLAFIDNCRVAG